MTPISYRINSHALSKSRQRPNTEKPEYQQQCNSLEKRTTTKILDTYRVQYHIIGMIVVAPIRNQNGTIAGEERNIVEPHEDGVGRADP